MDSLLTTDTPAIDAKMPSTVHLFSSLPLEIRLIIWELTFHPRVIELLYDHAQYNEQPDGSCDDYDDRRFSIADDDLPLVAALSVCQESRLHAKKKGYRPWKLQNISDEIKQVMWNPELDVVFCARSWEDLMGGYVPSFKLSCEFPVEAALVRHLALPSSQFSSHHQKHDFEFIQGGFVEFKNLREICIVVDIPFEYDWAVGCKRRRIGGNRQSISLPDTVRDNFVKQKILRPGLDWEVPMFRVVACPKNILGGETSRFVLRCQPCVDMRDILQTDAAKELIEAASDNITLRRFCRMDRYPPEWFLS